MLEVDIDLIDLECVCDNEWFEEEKKNLRKRFPDEEFFPDDYYERMEKWWISSPESRKVDPLWCEVIGDRYLLTDGHHRYAISKKNGIKVVPINFKQNNAAN